MHVIAKMTVSSVEDYGWSRKLKMQTVYDNGLHTGDNPENRSFTQASPSGELWMTIDNKFVWPAFRLPRQEDGVNKPASTKYVVFIDADEYSLAQVHEALATLSSLKD